MRYCCNLESVTRRAWPSKNVCLRLIRLSRFLLSRCQKFWLAGLYDRIRLNRHHWPFDDPAHATGTEEEKIKFFRNVRDEIRAVFEAYAAGRIDGGKLIIIEPLRGR
jgi:hypothetical protein